MMTAHNTLRLCHSGMDKRSLYAFELFLSRVGPNACQISDEESADVAFIDLDNELGPYLLEGHRLPAMLAATVFLGVAANFYELLCTAGFPMVYTRLLSLQVPDRATQYGWLALYNLIYVLPLAAIVLVFVRTMGARRLGEREGRLLKLLSGLMMLGLGLCLVLAPQALGDPLVALALLAAALGLTGLAAWRGR